MAVPEARLPEGEMSSGQELLLDAWQIEQKNR